MIERNDGGRFKVRVCGAAEIMKKDTAAAIEKVYYAELFRKWHIILHPLKYETDLNFLFDHLQNLERLCLLSAEKKS